MSKHHWSALALLIWTLVFPARAQNEIPPPQPPYLQSIPDNSQWQITITTPPPATGAGTTEKAPEMALKSVNITITGDIRRDVYTWNNGAATEAWTYRGVFLQENLPSKEISLDDGLAQSSASASTPRDWGSFQWLAANLYKKQTVEAGVTCYEFSEGNPLERRALIDVKTHLPILSQEGNVICRYEQLSPPREKLTFPPRFAAKWEVYMTNIKKLSVNRPPR